MNLHIPRVEIVSPAPSNARPFVPVMLSRVKVDGEEWPVTGYEIKGNVDGIQTISLTFHADLTLAHPEAKP